VATTIEWGTKIITVLQADMTALGGGIYELDVDALRLELKALEDSEEGMAFPDTHRHSTEVVISGVTYTRFVEIINGYTITISPATAYIVSCTGANHNIADVLNNTTGPTFIVNNAAGLVTTDSLVANEDALTLNQFIALK
jgi:hypothetical protein